MGKMREFLNIFSKVISVVQNYNGLRGIPYDSFMIYPGVGC